MLEFEFDAVKNASNEAKHGIDFVAAQSIWLDTHRIEIPARTTDEARWMVIGRIDGRCWSAVVSYRNDELIRIISVRRSREQEEAIYEGR